MCPLANHYGSRMDFDDSSDTVHHVVRVRVQDIELINAGSDLLGRCVNQRGMP